MRLCFKQKTAYEMRISDWSSDVCSSDLQGDAGGVEAGVGHRRLQHQLPLGLREVLAEGALRGQAEQLGRRALAGHRQAAALRQRDSIGRTSCRVRVCQSVQISAVPLHVKHKILCHDTKSTKAPL